MKSKRHGLPALLACLASFIFMSGCGKDKVAASFPNGKPKIIRTYGLFGGAELKNLKREQTFYYNEHKESDSHWKDGKLDGLYEDYWHNGQKKSHGEYRSGEKEGEWEFYHNQFTVSSKGIFRQGRKEGLWKSLWENGTPKSEGNYSAGAETGTWTEWTAKGDTATVNSCFPSNAEGRYASYHANHTVKEEYSCRQGVPAGEYTKKDPDGTVVERGRFDAQGRKDGPWEGFWSEGHAAWKRGYAAGLEHDSGYAWDEAGRLREKSHFDSGTGERVLYDSLGHVLQRTRYAKGQPDGEDWSYWPIGKTATGKTSAAPGTGAGAGYGPKRQFVLYALGKPVTMQRWYSNGKPAAEGTFENGQRAGEWKDWWEDGTLKEISHFQGGEMHGERLFYDPKGKLIRTARYEHGYPAEGRIPKAVARGGIAGDSGAAALIPGKTGRKD